MKITTLDPSAFASYEDLIDCIVSIVHADPRVVRMAEREALSCSHCRPNRGENAKRQARPDKYKSRRRGEP